MVIYVLRHGETDWNTKHWLQGTTDIPLNQNGIEVAEITAEALKEVPFDVIFSSPLQRAHQTAEILRRDRKIPLIVDERLRAGEAVRRRTPQGFAPHRSGQRHDGQAQQNSSKRSGDHAHGLIRRSWV